MSEQITANIQIGIKGGKPELCRGCKLNETTVNLGLFNLACHRIRIKKIQKAIVDATGVLRPEVLVSKTIQAVNDGTLTNCAHKGPTLVRVVNAEQLLE